MPFIISVDRYIILIPFKAQSLVSHWICHTLLLQLAVSSLLLQLDVSTLLLHLDMSLQALMAWLAANGGHPAL